MSKAAIRAAARVTRNAIYDPDLGPSLLSNFPALLNQTIIAGYAPTQSEMDVWPLLHHLHASGRTLALPVVTAPETPLSFRRWTPDCAMVTDRYGIQYPAEGEVLTPDFVLVPLLAFTERGDRLGYGGGYYDRTLAGLRARSDVFACGVAYSAQEVGQLPTDAHDQRLNGILTPDYFKSFA